VNQVKDLVNKNYLVANYKLEFLDDHTLCTAGEAGKVTVYDLVDGKES
jgi:hypothetical protein